MGIPFGACVLPSGGTYGVNANVFSEHQDRYWLLSYLNSRLVTYFVRGILLRTNMITSGYVSRIPVIQCSSKGKDKLEDIAKKAIEEKIQRDQYPFFINKIDKVVFSESGLAKDKINVVKDFYENTIKRT